MVAAEKITALEPVTNDAEEIISFQAPYVAEVTLVGSATILFHRWSCESVAEKAAAAKNSRAKKTDDIASYVYRTDEGNLGLPGEYLRMAIINAARFRQDPRSPRKSAMDLFKAAVVPMTEVADLGAKDWDFVHRARVQVQRNGITRERPALREGWRATFLLQVLTPEYIGPRDLHDTITQAGRLIGVGDFRPTYGRFQVGSFRVLED